MAFWTNQPLPKPIDLHGEQLQLRVPQRDDCQQWISIRQASKEFLVPWEPKWPKNDLSRLGFRRRLKRYEKDRIAGIGETFFLVKADDNQPIGGLSITNIRYGAARSCSIGYWMAEEYAGQGFMRAAVDAIARYIFMDLKLCRIEAACLVNNARSARLLERAGFEQEGLVRNYLEINGKRCDHLLYSLVRDQQASEK